MADFRDQFRKGEPEERSFFKALCTCNKRRARNCAQSLFPCYKIMKKYNWKTDFLADMICGLTVGIMQLPQGKSFCFLIVINPFTNLNSLAFKFQIVL